MHKFLINFNYIEFSLKYFIGQLNVRKSFSLTFFFFPLCFPRTKHNFEPNNPLPYEEIYFEVEPLFFL